jgi:hypothetical protein
LTGGAPTSGARVYTYPTSPAGVPAGVLHTYRVVLPQLDVRAAQDGWAGIYLARNEQLLENRQTNPDFVYRTPLSRFANRMVPAIRGDADLDIGGVVAGTQPRLELALNQLFNDLLADAGAPRHIRVACRYAYELAAAGADSSPVTGQMRLDTQVKQLVTYQPVLLVPKYQFAPATDWDATKPGSFVSRLAAAIEQWMSANDPSATKGAFFFDVSLYSTLDDASQVPLLDAPNLRFRLDASN